MNIHYTTVKRPMMRTKKAVPISLSRLIAHGGYRESVGLVGNRLLFILPCILRYVESQKSLNTDDEIVNLATKV